jgi:hypothetical protein
MLWEKEDIEMKGGERSTGQRFRSLLSSLDPHRHFTSTPRSPNLGSEIKLDCGETMIGMSKRE